jgi:hypothetical protein
MALIVHIVNFYTCSLADKGDCWELSRRSLAALRWFWRNQDGSRLAMAQGLLSLIFSEATTRK